MLNAGSKIIKYNHGEKSMKASFTIYADLERLLEKMRSCQNNPEKSSTEKTTMHTLSGCSLFTNCSFHSEENQLDCYRGKDCMERFCKNLKEHATKIINYEKKEIIPLIYEKISLIKSRKSVTYAKKNLVLMMTIKSIIK